MVSLRGIVDIEPLMTLHDIATDIAPIVQAVTSIAGVLGVWFLWRQIKITNVWSRANTQHSLLSNLPTQELEKHVWILFEKLPKNPRGCLHEDAAPTIYNCVDDWVCVKTFLNKFEQLSAAVNAKVVDERYAYDVHGVKVVDAFLKFEAYIYYIRKRRDDFAIYLELEKVATRWDALAKAEQHQVVQLQKEMLNARGTKGVID